MGEQVNSVIDHLCEKFGTQAEQLLTEIARIRIAEHVFGVIVSVLIAVVCIAVIIYVVRKSKADESYDCEGPMIFAIVVLATAVMVACITGGYLVGWIASPRARAILEIMKMLYKERKW